MLSSGAQYDGNDAIRRVARDYDAAWNRADVSALVSLYLVRAVVVNPLGETARGQSAIRAGLEAFLSGPAKGSTHTSTITDVAHIESTVAVVDGLARLDGLRGESPSLAHHFTDIVVKTDTGWRIAHTRAYVFAESRSVTA